MIVASLTHLGPDLVGHRTPLGTGGLGGVPRAKAVALKAETTRLPLLPAWAAIFR